RSPARSRKAPSTCAPPRWCGRPICRFPTPADERQAAHVPRTAGATRFTLLPVRPRTCPGGEVIVLDGVVGRGRLVSAADARKADKRARRAASAVSARRTARDWPARYAGWLVYSDA